MIIIKIEGGLGNQMFQYALGLSLSARHKVPFKIDYSYLKKENQSGRDFRLFGFNIDAPETTEKEIAHFTNPLQKVLDKFRPEISRKKILEKVSGFNPEILERSEGYFVGHFNSPLYFSSCEEEVRKAFSLKNPLSPEGEKWNKEILATPNSVSVHIRRGDYINIPKVANVHGAIPLSYYEKACDQILGKFPDAKFFISSDDINWAKENFPKKYSAVFISSPEIPDYEEVILMSHCAHNITANSTFSFWSAWLNQNPQKIVITPKFWYRDKNREVKDLIPQNWLKL